MVEFVTFFLGILVGVHPVELDVSGPVAVVEILLDGQRVDELHQGPWSFECDFGPGPEPHELVAIARDERGVELDRAVQWINLGHQTFEARITLHRNAKGHPLRAEIDWAGIGSGVPEDIAVTFDGESLEVKDPSSIVLPSYNMEDFHSLSATIRMSGQTVRAFAGFGGFYGSEVKTGLTAIPIQPDVGSMPSKKKLRSWFFKDGQQLKVHAVEKGPAEIIVVWDGYAHASIDAMTKIHRAAIERQYSRNRWRAEYIFKETGDLSPITSVYFMQAYPAPLLADALEDEPFLISPRRVAREGGLPWLLRHTRPEADRPLQLADAVANAGVVIQTAGGRRAVVLMLGDDTNDQSDQNPGAVRAYLRQLRVPLYVWSVTSETAHPDWGDVRFIGEAPGKVTQTERLRQAVRDLAFDLSKQRVVWLEGTHLPQSIELGEDATRIHIAGALIKYENGRIARGGPP